MDYGNEQKNDLDAFNLDTEEFFLDPDRQDAALKQAISTPDQATYFPDRDPRNVGNAAIFNANSINSTNGETNATKNANITPAAETSAPRLGAITSNLPSGYSQQVTPSAESSQPSDPLSSEVAHIINKTDEPTSHEAKIINTYVEGNNLKLSQTGDIDDYYENIRLVERGKAA